MRWPFYWLRKNVEILANGTFFQMTVVPGPIIPTQIHRPDMRAGSVPYVTTTEDKEEIKIVPQNLRRTKSAHVLKSSEVKRRMSSSEQESTKL